MPVTIQLTPAELQVAAQVGIGRQYHSMLRGNRDIVNDKGYLDAVSIHILGALGEAALAKHLGCWWSFSEGTYGRQADLVQNIEARTRKDPRHDLIVRPDDRDDALFVLVTGQGSSFTIVGYLRGSAAKQPQWLRDYGGHGKPAYFVPQAHLRGITTLWEPAL